MGARRAGRRRVPTASCCIGCPSGAKLLTDRVARRLRSAILNGEIKPGERIRQAELGKELGISRIPVREALQLLQAEGLVSLLPHAGARVPRLDLDELLEIYQMRESLEPLAMTLSVPRLSDDDVRLMAGHAEAVRNAAAAGDIGRWVQMDQRFHFAALSGAPKRLLGVIENLWNISQHYRRTYLVLPERFELADLEHRLLLKAVESRSLDDAELIVLMHIRRTRKTLTEHGELFEA